MRELQSAAVLNRRSLGLALRIEPLGVGEAVILAPVGARLGVHVKDRIDDAAHIASHPQRSQRRSVRNRPTIIRPNVEEPLGFRHMAIAASDLVFFAYGA